MRSMYLDDMSRRNNYRRGIAGRGAAMAVELARDINHGVCYNCRENGHFKSDSKHGKGYIKLTNGEMFEGVFDHDMIEGNGIFYKKLGEIVMGYWIDNKLFLNQSYDEKK